MLFLPLSVNRSGFSQPLFAFLGCDVGILDADLRLLHLSILFLTHFVPSRQRSALWSCLPCFQRNDRFRTGSGFRDCAVGACRAEGIAKSLYRRQGHGCVLLKR